MAVDKSKLNVTKKQFNKIVKEEYEVLKENFMSSVFPSLRFMMNSALRKEGMDGKTPFESMQPSLDLSFSILDDFGFIIKPIQNEAPISYNQLMAKEGQIDMDLHFKKPDEFLTKKVHDAKVRYEWYTGENGNKFVNCFLV